MSSEDKWNEIYSARKTWGKYPPEELVRFVFTNWINKDTAQAKSVLDIGCGPGSGSGWFLAREGFDYFGIDISSVAIERAKVRFDEEGLKGNFMFGNPEELPYKSESFDFVIEIHCLQCNDFQTTQRIVDEIYRVLKKNGQFFSIATGVQSWGSPQEDSGIAHTVDDVYEGPLKGFGTARFTSRTEINELLKNFSKVDINESHRTYESGKHWFRNFIVSAEK